jgi:hypothetical protein
VTAGAEISRTSQGGTASGGISYTPIKMVTVAYNGSHSTNTQDPEGIQTTSGSHALSLTVRPHRLITTTAGAQYSFSGSTQAGAQDSAQTSYSANVAYTPLPTLSTTLTVARNESSIGGVLDSQSDAGTVAAAAKVFPGLNLDSAYTLSRAQSVTAGQEVLGQDVSFRATAQILPWISTTGNYGVQIRETTPAPADTDPVAVTHTIGGGTVYTLSRLVNFTTRFDYTVGTDSTALTQQYKVDWVPTSKTSFFVSYVTSRSEAAGVSAGSDTITLNGRWSVNRLLDLSADYSFSRINSGTTTQEVQSTSASASLRF